MFGRTLQQRAYKGMSYYFPLATRGVVDLRNYAQGGGRLDPQVLTNVNTVTRGAGPSSELPDAAVFAAASSQRLDFADHAQLSIVGDTTISGWVYLEDKPSAVRAFLDKWVGTGNQREYAIGHVHSTDRFRFQVSPDGTSSNNVVVDSATFGAPSLQTWYFLVCQYIAKVRKLRMSVNAGPFDISTALASEPFVGTGNGGFGNNFFSGTYFSGKLAGWEKDERLLSDAEIRWRYNGGRGRRPLPLA